MDFMGNIILFFLGLIILPFVWALLAKLFVYFLHLIELAINRLCGFEKYIWAEKTLEFLYSKKENGEEKFLTFLMITFWPIIFIVVYIHHAIILGYSLVFRKK